MFSRMLADVLRWARPAVTALAVLLVGLGPSVGVVDASTSATVRSVTIMNESSQTIDLAIVKKWGSPCGGPNWYFAGWWTLDPGQSERFQTTSSLFYYHGKGVDGGVWDGNDGVDEQVTMYASPTRFEWCESSSGGWYAAGTGEPRVIGPDDYEIKLRKVDLSEYRSYTQRLTG